MLHVLKLNSKAVIVFYLWFELSTMFEFDSSWVRRVIKTGVSNSSCYYTSTTGLKKTSRNMYLNKNKTVYQLT